MQREIYRMTAISRLIMMTEKKKNSSSIWTVSVFVGVFLFCFNVQVSLAQSWSQKGADINGVANEGLGVSLSMSADGNTIAIGNNDDDVSSNAVRGSVKVKKWNGTSWEQKGSTLYAAQSGDNFGSRLSLSADGNVLAIGAYANNSTYGEFMDAGAAYVYAWSGSDWVMRGTVFNAAESREHFGESISISEDGSVLAVGAPSAEVVSGTNHLRGAVRVYKWSGSSWAQLGTDRVGEVDYENLGTSVSVKDTGSEIVLAAGGSSYTSSGLDSRGLVKIYRYSAGNWSAPVVKEGDAKGDYFGNSVSLSSDAKRLAIGAPTDLGIYSIAYTGYVRVLDFAAGTWTAAGGDIISSVAGDEFGKRVTLSGDGTTLIVGAPNTVSGTENEFGRAEGYTYSAGSWQKVGSSLKGQTDGDSFAESVAINSNGTRIAVGASNNGGGGVSSGQVKVFSQACVTPAAPTGTATQTFCSGATVAQLTATGTDIKWYASASAGTALESTAALVDGTSYYATQSADVCESTTRLAVTVTLLPLPTQPAVSVTQPTCTLATGTITVTTQQSGETYSFNNGTDYQSENTKASVPPGTYEVIIKGTDGCASKASTAVVKAQPETPALPVVSVIQPTCATPTGTVTVTKQGAGETYSFNNGTNFQTSNIRTGLAAGTYQVIINSASDCNSAVASVTVNAAPAVSAAPTGDATQSFCNSATVAQLTATGTAIKWYAAATDGTALASTTALENDVTYYASQTVTCESTSRMAVKAIISKPTAPTGDAKQVFCKQSAVADLSATASQAVNWYTTATGGTALERSTVLTTGTYYGGYTTTQGGCESPRLAVAVDYAYFWKTMTAGLNHTLAIQLDGTLWAWGRNSNGELGIGNSSSKQKPIQVGSDRWTAAAAGNGFSAGIKQDGTLWTWGKNDVGQLGNGNQTNSNVPGQVGTDKWTSVSALYDHVLALRQDGTLWTWGGNTWAQLTSAGGNKGEGFFKNQPLQIGTDNKWVFISAGWGTSAGIKQDGTLWTWGDNQFGQLGRGPILGQAVGDPEVTQVGTDKWKTIYMGVNSSIGIKQNNTLWASGSNLFGQQGNGTSGNGVNDASVATHAQIGTDSWISASISARAGAAIKQDGTLWTWGNNGYNLLGDGTTKSTTTPAKIGTSNKWISVVSQGLAPSYSEVVLGLQQDRTLWSWGTSYTGELGTGNTDSNIPTLIGAVPAEVAKPTLKLSNLSAPVLTASAGNNYLWFKNGAVITGATSSTYTPPATGPEGKYTVVTIDAKGCVSPLSNEVVIYITGLEETTRTTVQLYPNPARESILVPGIEEHAQVRVFSLTGTEQHLKSEWLAGENARRVNVSELTDGIYLLQVQHGNKSAAVKFIKQ